MVLFPLLSYYLWKGKEVEFFDNDGSTKNKGWVRKLIEKGGISEIPPVGYAYNECHWTALDNVDKAYQYTTNSSPLIREMTRIYENEDIELAYKKGITRGRNTKIS